VVGGEEDKISKWYASLTLFDPNQLSKINSLVWRTNTYTRTLFLYTKLFISANKNPLCLRCSLFTWYVYNVIHFIHKSFLICVFLISCSPCLVSHFACIAISENATEVIFDISEDLQDLDITQNIFVTEIIGWSVRLEHLKMELGWKQLLKTETSNWKISELIVKSEPKFLTMDPTEGSR